MKIVFLFISILSASIAESNISYDQLLGLIKQKHYKNVADFAIHNGFPNFENLFLNFKLKYRKTYESKDEELRKFNFMNSLKVLEANRQKFLNGEVLHELAINHFSDLSEKEYSLMLNGLPLDINSASIEEDVTEIDENLPESFDWREKSGVTPIKNQGSCGSCWAFATVAAIESAYAIKNNVTLDLSEQELVDCSSDAKYHSQGCHFGFNDQAFQYVIDNGLIDEKNYPYVHKQNQCQTSKINSSHQKWFIKKYKVLRFNATDEEVMATIYNNGPVTVQINADGNDFKQYHQGILTGGPKGYPFFYNHIVTVIGWGLQNNTKYWIIKNSWGQNWGQNGFAYLKREIEIRGLNDFAVYPIF